MLNNYLVYIKGKIFLFPTSVRSVFNYMCVRVCVCVCAGVIKVLLLRSVISSVPVSSKNFLRKFRRF